LKKIDAQKNSSSKKLNKRFSTIYRPIVMISIFFAGYWTAVVLSKNVPLSTGAIAIEAIFGGFLSVLITSVLIPSLWVVFKEWGAHGYSATFLTHVLKEHHDDILIIAGDLSWIEKKEYGKALEALKDREGESVHLLCIDPKCAAKLFPRKDPEAIRKRIENLEKWGLPRKNISYHTQQYRGILLHNQFALRMPKASEARAWWLKIKYGSFEDPDYMNYHKDDKLIDTLWKIYYDYVRFAPSPSSVKEIKS